MFCCLSGDWKHYKSDPALLYKTLFPFIGKGRRHEGLNTGMLIIVAGVPGKNDYLLIRDSSKVHNHFIVIKTGYLFIYIYIYQMQK